MPTLIDSLVVNLGLDSRDLNSKSSGAVKKLSDLEKAGDNAEKSTKKLGKTSKETASGLADVAKSAGEFLAVLGGAYAIKAFISDFIETNAQLKRFSENIGESVENVSAWGQAAEQFGGSAAGLQGTLDMLSKSQTQLRLTGESSLIPLFSYLGVSAVDFNGKAKTSIQLLEDIGNAIDTKGMSRQDANNTLGMFGIDQGTANLLLQDRASRDALISKIKEQTAVTGKQADAALRLNVATTKLKQSFMAVGRSLLESALPFLERMVGWLTRLSDWVSANSEFVGDFLKVTAVSLGLIAAGFGLIAIATSPISLIIAAVLALAAGIALLWQDYQTWKRGGDSLIDWGKWEPGINAAIKGVEALGNALKNTLGYTKEFMEWGRKKLGGDDSTVNKTSDKVREFLRDKIGLNKGKSSGGGGSNAETLSHAIERVEGEYAKSKDGKLNRPQRNNNPGNIEYGPYAKSKGATGSDGRFAIFPNYETGHKALVDLLQGKNYANLTVAQAIEKYAPSKENDTASYIASVTKGTGLSPDSIVGGGYAKSLDGAATPAGGGGSQTIAIDKVEIHTQATDAKGMAEDVKPAFDYLFTSNANSGLN